MSAMNCQNCKSPMLTMTICGKTFVHCQVCAERAADEAAARDERAREASNGARFLQLCPEDSEFHKTELPRLSPKLRAVVTAYRVQSKGVGLIGRSGGCKTRSCYLMIQAACMSGATVYALTSTRFAHHCAMQFDGDKGRASQRELEQCRRVKVLLLDDLGKEKGTARFESELLDLLEHRTTTGRQTLWTSNMSLDVLNGMFSPDRGNPIIRRIEQFSEIIHL